MRIDPLEPRKLLATAIDAGRLLIEGTAGDDRIFVGFNYGILNAITVEVNGTRYFFQLGSIKTIDIHGGSGRDRIEAGDIPLRVDISRPALLDDYAAYFILGGTGDDRIYASCHYGLVYGNQGNDRIYLNAPTIVHGGDGDDFIEGANYSEIIFGDDGNDAILGNTGNDYLEGGLGNDTIIGGVGKDTLRGSAGEDRLYSRFETDWGDIDADIGYGGPDRDWFDTTYSTWKKTDYKSAQDQPFGSKPTSPGSGVTKTGTGTLTISGQATDAQAGHIVNNSGTLQINANYLATAISGTLTGSTINLNSSGVSSVISIPEPKPLGTTYSPTFINVEENAFLYDGVSVPNAGFAKHVQQSVSPKPFDFIAKSRARLKPYQFIIPKDWILKQVEIRQGDIVWYRISTKTSDKVLFNTASNYHVDDINSLALNKQHYVMTARYLAVKIGTALITETADQSIALSSHRNDSSLRFTPRTKVYLAGDTTPLKMSNLVTATPPMRRGLSGILLNEGIIWITDTGNIIFDPVNLL